MITELVVNHTSDQHAWFRRARRAKPGSAHRDFYVWSDSTEKYREARIIFKDFEVSNWTWDEVAQAYYWHRFYSHQPDLNYDNPAVLKAVLRVMDFWLDLGVDGMRLDAVPYLIEREGTSSENLPETHQILKKLRAHVDRKHHARMLLAEANQWPEDAVAYFGEGEGDECHMAFHFPLMPRMFMALRMEDRYPIIDILSQTPPVPDTAQWAIFLRNHDELTLEMVTDEERDYMYRVYAEDAQARINLGIRRRLAPLLGNDRRRIELMNGLLFSLPGTPVLYYGDEIGMGDNIYLGDRNGVRTPMQWTADRNAGFSRANPQKLYLPPIIDPDFSYETVNVETQLNNTNSLLWWMKRLIALRKRFKAFGRGTLEFLHPANPKVLAFIRRFEDERILVVANLSRHAQYVELDLSEFKEMVPVELFGQMDFPRIGELPYLLTPAPHAFYWFALEARASSSQETTTVEVAESLPTVTLHSAWEKTFGSRGKAAVEGLLPAFLRSRRWFGGKARRIKEVEIVEAIPIPVGRVTDFLTLVQVDYTEGDPETYVVTLGFATGPGAGQLLEHERHRVLAHAKVKGVEGVLHESFGDRGFAQALLDAIGKRRTVKGAGGELVALPSRGYKKLRGSEPLEPVPLGAEQSNSSILFGDRLILKIFRRIDSGVNPDIEIGRFLTEQAGFPNVAAVAGSIEYRPRKGGDMSVAILQDCVENEGDAWRFTLDAVDQYFEEVVTRSPDEREPPVLPDGSLVSLARARDPEGGPGDHGLLPERRVAPRPTHRGDAPRPLVQCRRPGLLPGAVHPLLPAVSLPVDAEPHRAEPRSPQAEARLAARGRSRGCEGARGEASRRPQEVPGHPRPSDHRPAHPGARGLPPGAGPAQRGRLRHHRLRGRARGAPRHAPPEALSAARRGGDGPLLPLRRPPRPAQPRGARNGPAGRAARVRALGRALVPLGVGELPPRVPGDVGGGPVPARGRAGARGAADRLSPGEGHLRAGIRAEQPPGLGAPAPGRHRPAPE